MADDVPGTADDESRHQQAAAQIPCSPGGAGPTRIPDIRAWQADVSQVNGQPIRARARHATDLV